jgi:hypothetical protein
VVFSASGLERLLLLTILLKDFKTKKSKEAMPSTAQVVIRCNTTKHQHPKHTAAGTNTQMWKNPKNNTDS